MALDWASEIDLGRDTALEEYKQQLWVTIGKTKNPEDRRILRRRLERLNIDVESFYRGPRYAAAVDAAKQEDE